MRNRFPSIFGSVSLSAIAFNLLLLELGSERESRRRRRLQHRDDDGQSAVLPGFYIVTQLVYEKGRGADLESRGLMYPAFIGCIQTQYSTESEVWRGRMHDPDDLLPP